MCKKKYFIGDAFNLIKSIEDESIDLILTSPPYWGLRTYGQEHNWNVLKDWRLKHSISDVPSYEWYKEHGGVLGLEPTPDWYVSHLVEFFDLCRVKLKAGGNLWVNLGDTYFARWSSIRDKGRQGLGSTERERRTTPMGGYLQEKQLLLIPARFAIAMQDKKWILRNDVIWWKPNIAPRPERDRLRLSHEHFFHFVKKPKEGRAKYYYDFEETEEKHLDVVECNVRAGTNGHSATFPKKIISPRILSSSPLGGLLLDPFCGSGVAVETALELGRNAIGFEIREQFVPSEKAEVLYAAG